MFSISPKQRMRLKAFPQLLAALTMTFSGCKKRAAEFDDGSTLHVATSSQIQATQTPEFKQKYQKTLAESLDKTLDQIITEQVKLASMALGDKKVKVDGKDFGHLKQELELTRKFLKDNGVNLSLTLRTYLSNRGMTPEQLMKEQIDEKFLKNIFATAFDYKEKGMMNFITLNDLSADEMAKAQQASASLGLGQKYEVECDSFLRGAARSGNPALMQKFQYCKKHGGKPVFKKITVDCDKAGLAKSLAGAGGALCTAAGAVLCLMTAGIGCGLMAVCTAAAAATEVGSAAAQAIGGCCKGNAGHADGGAGC